MAKTYLAGEAAVKLTPNSGGFHLAARRQIKEGGELNAPVKLQADATGFRASARERLNAGPQLTHKVKLTVDSTGFGAEVKAKVEATNTSVKVKTEITGTAEALRALRAELAAANISVDVKVNIDENGYRARLQLMTRTVTQRVRVDMDADSLNALRDIISEVGSNTTQTTTTVVRGGQSMVRALLPVAAAFLAIAAISLIPLIGQLSQALGVIALIPAMAGAAALAIGSIAIGMEGIGKAFSAKPPKAQGSQSTAIAEANKLAQQQRAQASAERGLANAQRQSLAALKKLNDERKMAVRRLRDMNDELDSSVLSEEDAQIAILRAREALGESYATGTALDQREARNAVRTAEEGLDQIMKKTQDLRADTSDANRAGVEGDAQVVAAKESVIDANDSLTDAIDSLTAAQERSNQATATGVETVDELAEALANLSPNARAFVETVRGYSDEWKALRLEVQDSLFEGFSGDVDLLAQRYLPTLREGLSGIAGEINGPLREAMAALDTDGAQATFQKIIDNVTVAVGPFTDGLLDLGAALGNIASIGSEFLPGLGEGFEALMERFKNYTSSEEGQAEIRSYIDESLKTVGMLWDFVFQLGRVIGGIFSTSDDAGESMLEQMTGSLKNFADWMETAEGDQRMKEFWESIRTSITDMMNLMGLAITLADKVANILGLGETTTADGEVIKPENSGTDALLNGTKPVDKNGNAVDVDGNPVFRPGGTEGFWSFLPDVGKDSPAVRLGGWISDFFVGSDSDTPDNVYGTSPGVGQGPRGARDYAGIADSLTPPEESLTRWDEFKNKVAGVKDTLLGENGATGWLGNVGTSFDVLGDKVGDVKDSVGEKIGSVRTFIGDLKDDAAEKLSNIGGFFGDLGTKVGDVLGDIIDAKFPWLKTALDGVQSWFSTVTAAIGEVWSGLKAKAAEPINWIIDNVINGALKSAWNAVAAVIPGLEPWDGVAKMDVPNDGAGTGDQKQATPRGFWTGGVAGVMPGYTPGRDPYTIGVSGGEAIMRPEFTRGAGKPWIDEMNGVARREGVAGVQARMANYAFGGVVDESLWANISAAFPNATLNSAYRPGDSGYHGKGGAVDIGGPMQEVADYAVGTLGKQLAQVIWGPGPLLYNVGGNWIGDQSQLANSVYAGDLPGHFDHVHIAADQAIGAPGAVVSEASGGLIGAVRGAASSALEGVRGIAAGGVRTALSGIESKIPDFGDSMIGSIPKEFFGAVKDKITSAIAGAGNTVTGNARPAGDLIGTADQYRPLVERLFDEKGIDRAYVDKYLYQLQRESTFNPNAFNDWDSNYKKGTPSKGIAQVIDPTFESYKDPGYDNIWNAEDNIRASLNYLLRDPKFGGQGIAALTGAGYDQGGIANGYGVMPKYTIEPERVLDPIQTRAFEQLIPLLKYILPNLAPNDQKDPIPVTIADTGTLNGQPLQGATVGPNGEYVPAPTGAGTRGLYDVGPGTGASAKQVGFSTTPAGKTAMSLAGVVGLGNQAQYLASKEAPLMELGGGITAAMAAAAGGPQAFAAHAATVQASTAANIAKNFADYAPEAAGGIAESALSAIAGPLIGTVNTGMSRNELVTTMSDVQNRAARRTTAGRRRRK